MIYLASLLLEGFFAWIVSFGGSVPAGVHDPLRLDQSHLARHQGPALYQGNEGVEDGIDPTRPRTGSCRSGDPLTSQS